MPSRGAELPVRSRAFTTCPERFCKFSVRFRSRKMDSGEVDQFLPLRVPIDAGARKFSSQIHGFQLHGQPSMGRNQITKKKQDTR